MIGKILVPVDGSEHADKALRFALDLAEKDKAELILLHVLLRELDVNEVKRIAKLQGLPAEHRAALERMTPRPMAMGASYVRATVPDDLLRQIGHHILGIAEREAKAAGLAKVATRLEDGDPARVILSIAEQERVGTIVMGSRGLGSLQALFVGSVSHKVSQHAQCTCVLVK